MSSIKDFILEGIQTIGYQLTSTWLDLESTHLLDLEWPLYPTNGAISLSRQRLKTVQHAHAYLTRDYYYALLTKAIGLSQQQLKTIPHAYDYSYRGNLYVPWRSFEIIIQHFTPANLDTAEF